MNAKVKNKRSKLKSRDIDIFGTKFLLPKGIRKQMNTEDEELKNKKLNSKDLPKVLNFIKRNQKI